MRSGLCRLSSTPSARARAGLEAAGAGWARFGAELFLFAASSKWPAVERALGREKADLVEIQTPFRRRDLHLVVQKGRLFQIEQPKVPVLVDKGRFLVAALDRKVAVSLHSETPCWRVRPLEPGSVVFDERPAGADRRGAEARIQSLVDALDGQALEASLARLTGFATRHSLTAFFREAVDWASGELSGLGYAVRRETVPIPGGTTLNLVADRSGMGGEGRGLVLVVAHLDSINAAGGRDAPAPGADDNASGSAGLLEIARVLAREPLRHDLRLVLFGGEEQGLFGSRRFVEALAPAERERIKAVVNMDMIACRNTEAPTVLLEGAPVSQSLIDALADAAAAYTALVVQTALDPFASDHVPFIEAGIPAVLTIEGADRANDRVHTERDRLDTLDLPLALEILRMNLACLAKTLEQADALPLPDRPVEPERPPPLPEPAPVPTVWTVSGRYAFNGGADARLSASERSDPPTLHSLPEPIYLDPPTPAAAGREPDGLRFTLHLDVDGSDPLGVVSGSVGAVSGPVRHFIGRVRQDVPGAGSRELVVLDFAFAWPIGGEGIERLELRLTGDRLGPHMAEAVFVSSAGARKGPFEAVQASTVFREVEVEVDREDSALPAEPYDSFAHPDRPLDLPQETLTLESAFAHAGIRIRRSGGANVVDTSDAGTDSRWNEQELHDAMETHWSAFQNAPQWKLWIFLAELAVEDTLGGIMFDGEIDEPGGVDRQGTAVFTKSPHFHLPEGAFPRANPPADVAARRELFFDLIHEAGHAFNLAHSFQKTLGNPWRPPAWMPLRSDPQAGSWMNYPDLASPGDGLSAKWFYDRFRFRFSPDELLFLRHAPARFVQMGAEAWFVNHGRVERGTLDRRLELALRAGKTIFELGEPVTLELKLKNVSDADVTIHDSFDLGDGFVRLAITGPSGVRSPFLPFAVARSRIAPRRLGPKEAVFEPVGLSIGKLGIPFKTAGAYRIEASFSNLDGSTAAAILQIYVRPPASFDDLPTVNELFDARVGRVLAMRGSRVMEDVLDRLDWTIRRLGPAHPVCYALRRARVGAFAEPFKLFDRQGERLRLAEADPEAVVEGLAPVVEHPAEAADSIGHIGLNELIQRYAACAVEAGQKAKARTALEDTVALFDRRGVVPSAIAAVEERLRRLR